jgi:hypothetical protein
VYQRAETMVSDPGSEVVLSVAESPALEDSNASGRLILGADGNAMGWTGADDTSKQAPARRPARLGPGTVGHGMASALEVSEMAKKNKQQHTPASGEAAADPPPKLKRKAYEREMRRLHGELVAMQEWVKTSGAKLCIVRGPRHRRQGGHDQADHRAGEPARVPGRRPGRPDRA